MRISFFVVGVFILLFNCPILAQHDNHSDDIDDYTLDDLIPEPINDYTIYTASMGYDSIRMCDGRPCNGMIKDNYFSGEMRHKGYYIDGKLTSTYRNYWDNGQEERVFKVKGGNKSEVEIFYPDGSVRIKAIFIDGQAQYWEQYYANGNMEFIEEYDNKLEYRIKYNFFYLNGNPQSTLELIDKKKNLYASKEYHKNGNIKEEGERIYNEAIFDYQKHGTWKVYDKDGKLLRTEEYYKGELITE
jgi:antitoxin component YwqK of YwqJK toxin-antitoxin module